MNNPAESRLPPIEPLSSDEAARAVGLVHGLPIDLSAPVSVHAPEHDPVDLRRMNAAQRFWLAFTGKPGSSGRAGPRQAPGMLRSQRHRDEESLPRIPRQPGPLD